MNEEIIIPIGWSAFIKDKKYYGTQEFKKGGKYYGSLDVVSKPTEEELKAELKKQGCTLVEPKK